MLKIGSTGGLWGHCEGALSSSALNFSVSPAFVGPLPMLLYDILWRIHSGLESALIGTPGDSPL